MRKYNEGDARGQVHSHTQTDGTETDSPACGGESMGRRVAVECAGPGDVGDGLGGELPSAAEAGVAGRVADAERDEAPAALAAAPGHRQQLAHHAPDGRLAVRMIRQRRVAPHQRRRRLLVVAAVVGDDGVVLPPVALILLQQLLPRCLLVNKQTDTSPRRLSHACMVEWQM